MSPSIGSETNLNKSLSVSKFNLMTIPLFALKVLGLSPRTVKERCATLYTTITMIVATGSAIFITYLYIMLPLGYTTLSEVT